MSNSRFVVGIDLGTTNTVLAFGDVAQAEPTFEVRPFEVPQLTAPGLVEAQPVLPSFLYLPAGPEFADGALELPWNGSAKHVVGRLARDQGNKTPSRVVMSAKSWLCQPGIDHNSASLPWKAPPEVPKVSPVEACAHYLSHLRGAWNQVYRADRLETQEIFLTVPASFDAVARDLTLSAARQAGLSSLTLLEEPQAAFYAWLEAKGETWREQISVGDTILVCDVGGGTTDFSLIAVQESDGALSLERVAVGQHILLGGDNMDLALAHAISTQFGGAQALDPWQTRSLWHACRSAKERLLADQTLGSADVTILGRGSKLIGGTKRGSLDRDMLEQVVTDGFFPTCNIDDRPRPARRSGFQELGLSYASDAGITRHLAKFLSAHLGQRPVSSVLFNGGVMKASLLRRRVVDQLQDWFGQPVHELAADDLDLAVSRGAAYYGHVRRGNGVRIRGGVGRSYYIGIESAMPAVPGVPPPIKALCVVPFGMEEGSGARVEGQELAMAIGEPAEFRFLSSTVRKEDTIGTLVDRWCEDELEELSPVQASMDGEVEDGQDYIAVRLHSRVTEVGTLDLQLQAADGRRWKLEYEVRDRH